MDYKKVWPSSASSAVKKIFMLHIHDAQLLRTLSSQKSLGLLINFNVVHLKDGIKRIANGL